MKERKKKLSTKNKVIFGVICSLLLVGILCILLKMYIDYVDAASNKIEEQTDISYTTKSITTLSSGLVEVNIYDDLLNYIKDRDVTSTTYKISNEQFYFDVSITKEEPTEEESTEEVKYTFTIDKIVDKKHKINAKMNLRGIKKIQFKTGNANETTLLNLISEYDQEYLAIINGNYYFLGDDIESITYEDNHFYYVSHNKAYNILKTAKSCSKDIKKSIDGFSMNDSYYTYGKINFLDEYYQKLSSKKYTVKEKCAELENNLK